MSEPVKIYMGRRALVRKRPAKLGWREVAAILDSVWSAHQQNSDEIKELDEFFKGKQPVLWREKSTREEITNIVKENRAHEVVEFKVGYEFSHPVRYTNASNEELLRIDLLNKYARLDGKDAKDVKLAENFFKGGIAHKLVLPSKVHDVDTAPYWTKVLNSRFTFVVYDAANDDVPLLSCSYVSEENATGDTEYRVGVYTDKRYYEWVMKVMPGFRDTKPERDEANTLGLNPIIEYALNQNRMGYVELCYELFNAINTLNSNRLDGIEQFIQAILWFNNCKLTDESIAELKDGNGGMIFTANVGQGNATVKYLIEQLNQEQAQITKEDLLQAIYEISAMPSRQQNRGGGDTGQAVVLRNGWGAAEASAKTTEKFFTAAETRYLKIVLKILRGTRDTEIGGVTLGDIDIQFTRNRSDNMLVKAQSLQLMQAGGVNIEDAYETCELFADPVAVAIKSKAEQEQKLAEAHARQLEIDKAAQARQAEKEQAKARNSALGINHSLDPDAASEAE